MNDKRIEYGDSKAIKITSDMRNDLNSFNSRQNEIFNLEQEKENIEKSRVQNETELEQSKSDGKASKETKNIEKELEKNVSDIKRLEEKIKKLVNKHKSPELEGVSLTSFAKFIESQKAEDPIAQTEETVEEIPVPTAAEEIVVEEPIAPEPVTEEPVAENSEAAPVIPEIPIISAENSESKEETTETEAPTPEVEIQAPVEEPQEEQTPEPEVQVEAPVEAPVAEPEIPEVITEPIVTEEKETSEETSAEPEKPEETEKEPIQTESSLISELETAEDEPKAEENVNKEPANEYNMFNYDFVSQSEFEKMWQDLQGLVGGKNSKELSNFDENEFFEQINLKPQIPEPIKVTRIEENPDDLTKFNDYNDYVFAFGQNYYGKEALTPVEIDNLNEVGDFLNEEKFDIKRNTQYINIVNENADLKDQMVDLDNNYRKELENISAEYSANMNELKKLINSSKEQAENIKFEKEQTDKLNLSLTSTIKDQDQTILDLNVKNSGLQDTIVNQSSKITTLEKTNEEQSERIKELEEKLSSVRDIIKEID